jgi:cytochrome c553
MSDGPVANYVYKPWKDRPGRELGFNAVGPGWTHILETLDSLMANVVENAISNATIARPEYRVKGNTAEATIEVVQIKEKFGGLRVYYQTSGIGPGMVDLLDGAVRMAEGLAYITCEKCSSLEGTETRIKKSSKYGRTLTLCASCHGERDNSETFEMGNGDTV